MEIGVGLRVRSEEAVPGPVLALDTSTERAAVALDPGDGILRLAPAGTSRQHGRGLIAVIRDLLRQGGVRPGDLSAIGIGLGPGSFTGLRIGVTAAKTLAYAVGCPLIGYDSLEAIVQGCAADAGSSWPSATPSGATSSSPTSRETPRADPSDGSARPGSNGPIPGRRRSRRGPGSSARPSAGRSLRGRRRSCGVIPRPLTRMAGT